MINFLNIFVFNLIFNNFLINFVFNKDTAAANQVLENLQNDFTNIGFPLSFIIDSLFISTLISIVLSCITYSYLHIVPKTPTLILKEIGQLGFIYSGVLLGLMYLLRLYNLSRGYIVLAIIFYPLIYYLVISILRLEVLNNSRFKVFFSLLFFSLISVILVFTNQDTNEDLSIESITSTTTTTSTTVFVTGIVEAECYEWLGSENFSNCLSGAEVVKTNYFSESLNNVIIFENEIYVLDVFGRIFKNSPNAIFLDISDKVLNRIEHKGDAGLFSLAFHPNKSFFLVSYSDLENNLIVEKFALDSQNQPDLNSSEVVVKIPNSNCCHYSGNLIWSDFFNDFLLSVGDMEHSNIPFENSNPLDTSSSRGKVLLLNKEISNPELLSLQSNAVTLKNIVAYGLRNPWKTFEYKNYLFVPDVGLTGENELTVLNLNEINETKKPFLLGWPHFEGSIYNNLKYNDILYHDQNTSKSINQFVLENTIMPDVYYANYAPENYRAAIIGGGIIEDKNSMYFENYIFADYLSGELFSYDFKNNNLKIIPIGERGSFITSLAIHPTQVDTVLITTGSGNLVDIRLP